MPKKQVHTVFDCRHETEISVRVDNDVAIPETVRGLGQCPDCMGENNLFAVPGIAPQPGGRVALDSILMIPV
jgi:hypothetical protein